MRNTQCSFWISCLNVKSGRSLGGPQLTHGGRCPLFPKIDAPETVSIHKMADDRKFLLICNGRYIMLVL